MTVFFPEEKIDSLNRKLQVLESPVLKGSNCKMIEMQYNQCVVLKKLENQTSNLNRFHEIVWWGVS